MCFVMPHTVIKFGLMMFCELIYVIYLSAMALSYCIMYVTGNFFNYYGRKIMNRKKR